MANDKCRMADDKCRMADDKCRMADDKCRMADDKCEARSGGCAEGERSEPTHQECRAPQKATNEGQQEPTQSSFSPKVKTPVPEPAGRQRSRSAAGGAVSQDAGNDPFDSIAQATKGSGRARGREGGSLVGTVIEND